MLTVDVGYQMTTKNTVITYNSAGKLEGIVEHTKNTATKKGTKTTSAYQRSMQHNIMSASECCCMSQVGLLHMIK